ncbi:MAG: hypothetical protein ACE5LF_04690 [Alphaproteobacteria bacterium]
MWKLPVLASAIALAGCATIVKGTDQTVAVETPGVEEAECSLVDNKGMNYYVKSTPDSVVVNRGDGPLMITCEADGYKKTTTEFDEKFEGWTLGNVIFGGIVGVVVDAASGAAQQYPGELLVFMEPDKWVSEEQKQQWIEEKAAYEKKLKKHAAKDEES